MKGMRSKTGFTLLEVMVALAIIAGALVVILHCHLLGVNLANRVKGTSLASLLAQEKMEEIEMEEILEEGDKVRDEGGLFEEYPGFRWQVVVNQAELFEEEIEELKKVAVTVSWFDGRDEQELEVVSYLFRSE